MLSRGTFPVAPNIKRLRLSGDRKVRGFVERVSPSKLIRMVMANMVTFKIIIALINRAGSLKRPAKGL
jgi:hypothetical protein